jgi:hypothetical protein
VIACPALAIEVKDLTSVNLNPKAQQFFYTPQGVSLAIL